MRSLAQGLAAMRISRVSVPALAGGSAIRIEMKNLNAFPGGPAKAAASGSPAVPAKTSQVVDRVYLTVVYQVFAKLEERGAQVMD